MTTHRDGGFSSAPVRRVCSRIHTEKNLRLGCGIPYNYGLLLTSIPKSRTKFSINLRDFFGAARTHTEKNTQVLYGKNKGQDHHLPQ